MRDEGDEGGSGAAGAQPGSRRRSAAAGLVKASSAQAPTLIWGPGTMHWQPGRAIGRAGTPLAAGWAPSQSRAGAARAQRGAPTAGEAAPGPTRPLSSALVRRAIHPAHSGALQGRVLGASFADCVAKTLVRLPCPCEPVPPPWHSQNSSAGRAARYVGETQSAAALAAPWALARPAGGQGAARMWRWAARREGGSARSPS